MVYYHLLLLSSHHQVDIPNDKRIEISLTYIYGIGRQLSKTILNDAKVDLNKKAKDLTDDELSRIRKEIDKHLVEGDLRREVNMNIKTKMEINSSLLTIIISC